MSRSTIGHDEAKTSLLGGKELVKYNTLRRKVRETPREEETDLIPSGKQASRPIESNIGGKGSNIVLLYEDILPDDTLQSFALRYGCSVNDIKRANALIGEQDFYALKKLKIPVSRYSLLTVPEEKLRLQGIHDELYPSTSQTAQSCKQPNSTYDTLLPASSQLQDKPGTRSSSEFDSTESLEEAASLLPSLPSSDDWQTAETDDTSRYLKKLDKDIRKTVKKADMKNGHSHQNESLNEVLSSIQYYPAEPLHPTSHKGQRSNGADCGMKWWVVILCFFTILGVIIALAIFEYRRSE